MISTIDLHCNQMYFLVFYIVADSIDHLDPGHPSKILKIDACHWVAVNWTWVKLRFVPNCVVSEKS